MMWGKIRHILDKFCSHFSTSRITPSKMKCDGMKKAREKCIITSPFVSILHIFSSYHESPNNFCSCGTAISFSSPLVLILGGVSNAAFWINDRKTDKQKYINNIASPFSPTPWVLAAFFLKVYFAHFWKACLPRSPGVNERKERDIKQVFALFSSNYFPDFSSFSVCCT